jgi:hypothetical protein
LTLALLAACAALASQPAQAQDKTITLFIALAKQIETGAPADL